MKATKLLCVLVPAILLTGCMSTKGPTAAPTAASQQGASTGDAAITAKVKAALAADAETSASKVDVDTVNGAVRLKGEIKSMALRKKVESIAAGISGVKTVDNRLVITG